MRFKIQKKVGQTTVVIEDDAVDQKEFFKKASFVHSLPERCGVCHDDNIAIDYHTAQSYDFFEVVCKNPDCGQSLQFGQYKNTNGALFAKKWGPRKFMPQAEEAA